MTKIFQTCVLSLVVLSLQTKAQAQTIVGYVPTYANATNVAKIPWGTVDQVNIAFAGIDPNGACGWMDLSGDDTLDTTGNAPRFISKLIAARDAAVRNGKARTKLVLSVGGASMSYRFSLALNQNTPLVVSSCADLVRFHNLDGIDFDWEYPGSTAQQRPKCKANIAYCSHPNDAANLTKLIAGTRAELGKSKIIAVAVSNMLAYNFTPYDFAGMDANLDQWGVMTYDYNGRARQEFTGYNMPQGRAQASMQNFVVRGIAPKKLLLGVPFYSFFWNQAQSANPNSPATPPCDQNKGCPEVSFANLNARFGTQSPGCILNSTPDGDNYFCTSQNGNTWITSDGVSIMAKDAASIKKNGYGGAMIWTLDMDDSSNSLITALSKAMKPALSPAILELLL